jgi:hypothetical protein
VQLGIQTQFNFFNALLLGSDSACWFYNAPATMRRVSKNARTDGAVAIIIQCNDRSYGCCVFSRSRNDEDTSKCVVFALRDASREKEHVVTQERRKGSSRRPHKMANFNQYCSTDYSRLSVMSAAILFNDAHVVFFNRCFVTQCRPGGRRPAVVKFTGEVASCNFEKGFFVSFSDE